MFFKSFSASGKSSASSDPDVSSELVTLKDIPDLPHRSLLAIRAYLEQDLADLSKNDITDQSIDPFETFKPKLSKSKSFTDGFSKLLNLEPKSKKSVRFHESTKTGSVRSNDLDGFMAKENTFVVEPEQISIEASPCSAYSEETPQSFEKVNFSSMKEYRAHETDAQKLFSTNLFESPTRPALEFSTSSPFHSISTVSPEILLMLTKVWENLSLYLEKCLADPEIVLQGVLEKSQACALLLQEQADNCRELAEKIDELKQELEKKDQENYNLGLEKDKFKHHYDEECLQNAENENNFRASVKNFRHERSLLEKNTERLRASIADLKEEQSQLKQELEVSQEENKSALNDFEKAQEFIKAKDAEIEALLQQTKEVKVQFGESQTEVKLLRLDLAAKNAESETNVNLVKELQNQIIELTQKSVDTEQEKAELKTVFESQLQQLTINGAQKEAELLLHAEESEAKIRNYEENIKVLKSSVDVEKSLREDLQQLSEELQRESVSLKLSLSAANKRTSSLTEKLKDISADKEELASSNHNLQENIAQLRSQVTKSWQKQKATNDELSKCQAEIESIEGFFDQLSHSHTVLETLLKRHVKGVFECIQPTLHDDSTEEFKMMYDAFIEQRLFFNKEPLVNQIITNLHIALKALMAQYFEIKHKLEYEIEDKQKFTRELLDRYTQLVMQLPRNEMAANEKCKQRKIKPKHSVQQENVVSLKHGLLAADDIAQALTH